MKRADARTQTSRVMAPIPEAVVRARELNWGVFVDAFIDGAARVGDRFTGHVYFDGSGASNDGMVVVTPPVDIVKSLDGFKLLRSQGAEDYYVLCSLMEA
ncbi:hypothetical protein LZ023_14485 [Pseudomonas silvicola]|nr:hypothetical protein LZ023_14485 [Pseudomonas silvicola]